MSQQEKNKLLLLAAFEKKELGRIKLENEINILNGKIEKLKKEKTDKSRAYNKLLQMNPNQLDLFSGTADDIVNDLLNTEN